LADLKVERQLPDSGTEGCAAREVGVRPDPAGIDDVHVEDSAFAFERRVVLEAQLQVAAAGLELLVGAPAQQGRIHRERREAAEQERAVECRGAERIAGASLERPVVMPGARTGILAIE